MRILFAAHQFFPDHRAGVEIVTLGLARELMARGHEPFVLAAKRSVPHSDLRPYETEDYEYEGVPVRRIGRPEEGLSRPYRLNYGNEEMARKVREHVREVGPDVVHLMHLQGLSASAVPAARESGAPVLFTAADFWTICPVVDLRRHDGVMCEGPALSHCVRCIASRNPRLRAAARLVPGALLEAAGRISTTPLSRHSFALRQVRAVGERPSRIREDLDLVDAFIAYTELARDLLLANGVGEGRWRVSPYGIDTSRLAGVAGLRRPSPTLRLGYTGTLAPHKGCDILLRAFRALPPAADVTLRIHGDPRGYEPYFEELRALARGDTRISFHPPFAREEIGGVLREIDALVVPSRWYENAPAVVFEAFAAGSPVIATDLGGLSEFVKPGENGLLFGLDDPNDLALQLRGLLEDRGLLERLKLGIPPVKSVTDYAVELEELYGTLLERGHARDGRG